MAKDHGGCIDALRVQLTRRDVKGVFVSGTVAWKSEEVIVFVFMSWGRDGTPRVEGMLVAVKNNASA